MAETQRATLLAPTIQRSDGWRSRAIIRATPPNDRPCPYQPDADVERKHAEPPPLSNAEQFDLVIVCPDPNPGSRSKPNRRRMAIAARSRFVGLEVVVSHTRDGADKLLKLSAPDELLEEMAEVMAMEKRLKMGGYTAFSRAHKRLFMPVGSFNPATGCVALFSSLERSRLILAVLELGLTEGGCDVDLQKELSDGVLTAVVPVHEETAVQDKLLTEWAMAPLRVYPDQPLDEIRDYFGEEVALYFAFVQTLTSSLVAPSIAGLVAVGGGFIWGTLDNPLCPLYSVFILVWIVYFCKTWRREEAQLAFRWNSEEYEATERQRPEFQGPLARGFYSSEGHFIPITDDDKLAPAAPLTRRFTPAQRRRRILLSLGVVAPILVLMLAGMVGVLAYRSSLLLSFATTRNLQLGGFSLDLDPGQDASPPQLSAQNDAEHIKLPSSYAVTVGSVLGGMANSLFISLTNPLYAELARRINEWENHRTQTEHEDARILKTFCFQFVNSYASLFYLAFVKAAQLTVAGTPEYCHNLAAYTESADEIRNHNEGLNPYCMTELSTMLMALVITSQITTKLCELLFPPLMAWWRTWREEVALRKSYKAVTPMTYYQQQINLEPYGGVFDEYSRLILQIGYIVLFAPAFPLAAFVCYISFLLEIRTDAYKLLTSVQRPRYTCAQDIGSWQKVLVAIGVIGTFTNLAMIGSTSTALSRMLPLTVLGVTVHEGNQMLVLVVLEHLLLLTQFLVLYVLPDTPDALAITRAKAHWRRRATVALASSGGKPVVVDGTHAVKPQPMAWDDEALPDRFWNEGDEALHEPRQGREWARVLKAGEYKAAAAERQREVNALRLTAAKEARAMARAPLYVNHTVPPGVAPSPLPPPSAAVADDSQLLLQA